jgi:hypothetical protein
LKHKPISSALHYVVHNIITYAGRGYDRVDGYVTISDLTGIHADAPYHKLYIFAVEQLALVHCDYFEYLIVQLSGVAAFVTILRKTNTSFK